MTCQENSYKLRLEKYDLYPKVDSCAPDDNRKRFSLESCTLLVFKKKLSVKPQISKVFFADISDTVWVKFVRINGWGWLYCGVKNGVTYMGLKWKGPNIGGVQVLFCFFQRIYIVAIQSKPKMPYKIYFKMYSVRTNEHFVSHDCNFKPRFGKFGT